MNLAEIAKSLADGLQNSLFSQNPKLFVQLLRLLADGRPVSLEQIATALNISRDEVSTTLRKLPNTEFDHDGNVIGYGLTLTPTPYHFQVSGHRLFTWCAFDTLFFPTILKQPARVESSCHITEINIELTVTPEKVEHFDPASTVVSIVIPEASESCCGVRGTFCNQVHFFSSSEVASMWLKEHQGAIILPVENAHRLGCILSEHLFKESSDT